MIFFFSTGFTNKNNGFHLYISFQSIQTFYIKSIHSLHIHSLYRQQSVILEHSYTSSATLEVRWVEVGWDQAEIKPPTSHLSYELLYHEPLPQMLHISNAHISLTSLPRQLHRHSHLVSCNRIILQDVVGKQTKGDGT